MIQNCIQVSTVAAHTPDNLCSDVQQAQNIQPEEISETKLFTLVVSYSVNVPDEISSTVEVQLHCSKNPYCCHIRRFAVGHSFPSQACRVQWTLALACTNSLLWTEKQKSAMSVCEDSEQNSRSLEHRHSYFFP